MSKLFKAASKHICWTSKKQMFKLFKMFNICKNRGLYYDVVIL